ncbi:MAG: HD domain-containing protein [Kiritimatiellae bacterium]|nr:HD domain-containing protein [Kiritimatiellia bacterium]
MDCFEQARRGFDRYVAGFHEPDGSVPFAISAKFQHTGEVCELTDRILAGEPGFTAHEALIFRLCALFHDLSRFEQYAKFKTFLDKISFDHGDRSAALIDELGFIPDLPAEDRACVIDAVRVHNKFAIPDDLPQAHLPAAKMVRDADKLAILRLIIRFFSGDFSDPTIRLDLPDTPGWSPDILETALCGRGVHYTDMKSINDFKIALFAWSGDLNYPASAFIALDEDLFGRLRALLPADGRIDDLLASARARLAKLRDSGRA